MVIGEEEEKVALEKIQISGATLASLLQRFSSSPGDIEGFLFGHVTIVSPPLFSDDATSSSSPPPPPTSIATITSFLTSATSSPSVTSSVIGWFSGRRRSPLRPSLRDSLSLTSPLPPSSCRVFLLLTSPVPSPDNNDTTIHTHEYKAYQYFRHGKNYRLVPRTLEAVNIGPGFRNHYGSFSPTSPFPVMTPFENVGSSGDEKNDGMGLDVGGLRGLMGPEAAEYTGRVEDVYKGMLERLDQLAMMVHDSASKVFHQENQNMKLRFKIAGLE